jgi:CobQ-like glutamine amidotransferase family enzyme
MTTDSFALAVLFPEMLGTYGDSGNAIVLQQRLRWRNVAVEVIQVALNEEVPEHCDLFLLGGGEDGAQSLALDALRRSKSLRRAVARDVPVFAVCAGFQMLGTSITDQYGVERRGLGLLDVVTRPMHRRAVGDVLTRPLPTLGLPALSGFENHLGGTCLGSDALPFSELVHGVGNGPCATKDGSVVADGATQGSVIGTYLHGPVLARNPELADLLLGRACGSVLPPLAPAYGP